MATTIGTFTIKGDDLGNLPSYNAGFIYASSNEFAAGGIGVFTPGTLVQNLDDYVALVVSSGGTMTYSFSGPGVWNGGTDTIVTISISDYATSPGPEQIHYYLFFITEDYIYPVIWQTAAVTPTLCNECQFIQLNQCGDENFRLDLGLADGSYTAFYTDNTSGVIWEQGTYSDTAQGGIQVYQWQATAGMFNQYSFYTMTIKDTNGDAVSWVVDGAEYTCATLTFRTTVNVTD
jgi:hypothetical protein